MIYSGSTRQAEIEMSGSNVELVALGNLLSKPNVVNVVGIVPITDEYYSHPIQEAIFTITDLDHDKMMLNLTTHKLAVTGTKSAFVNFGQSLMNCFENDNNDGHHVQYDYLEGYGELGPTKHSLVVMQKNEGNK